MRTLQVPLDEEVDAALEALCARQQRAKETVVSELVRQFVNSQQARQTLQSGELKALYEQLADEDVTLAEAGMDDYKRLLEEADQA